MSYYVSKADASLVYFGESQGADQWIEANVYQAERQPGAQVSADPPTRLAPGVLRYYAPWTA